MEPTVLGEYRIIASLGRGGMAEVYLAVRGGVAGFHKLVVIKCLRADLAGQPGAAKYRALLFDEARLAARLHHPNIVQTFEVAEHAGQPYLAMEYLDGQPLNRVVLAARRAGAALSTPLKLKLVADVLAALEYAHALADFDGRPLRIVHRDISPQNVFWTYDGEIKLVDFGIAKFAHTRNETDAGFVKGKLAYMAPEQARGLPLDGRADLFAAGVILWELLANRRLLRAQTDAATLQRLLYEPLPPLARVAPELDPAIAAICDRALAREPSQRFPDARAMRAAIEAALGPAEPRRDELAAFVQPLFATERATVAQHIHEALADRAPVISLATAEVSSASSELSFPATAETVPEHAAPVFDDRAPARPSRRRAWLAALALAAGGLVALDLGIWLGERDPAPPSPAPAAALAALAAPAVPAPPPPAAPPPDLRLCGSNTVGAELAPALVEAFLRQKGASEVTADVGAETRVLRATIAGRPFTVEIHAAGTATAFEGLDAGRCDLGMASRPIQRAEADKLIGSGAGELRTPATEHVIGLDGIAVVVHPNNPLQALDREQLRAIFVGELTNWSQLGGAPGPITVLARDAKSGTFDTFKQLVLQDAKLAATARRFAHSDEFADAVAADPSAIGFIGLAYIRSSRALAIGDRKTTPMLPTSFTVATEAYMLSRRLFFYNRPRPRTPMVTELVSFALSPAAQRIVRGTGFIDLDIALRDADRCDARCPARYVALTARAQRVSLDFRFRTGSDDADSRAARDLDRLVQFLRGYPEAQLRLFGFSDGVGGSDLNVQLSRRRAGAIERALAMRGVRAAIVEGFGAALPVAPNTTEADRERNRRVEVWLSLRVPRR